MLHRPTRLVFCKPRLLVQLLFSPGLFAAQDKKPAANERLHVGVIGVALKASTIGEKSFGRCEIVAWCDVDETAPAKLRTAFPQASFDVDFRAMLDRKGIDAIVVATPDHTHAVAYGCGAEICRQSTVRSR